MSATVRPPKSVILDLLSAAPDGQVEVRGLVRAAQLFGITENNMRVALTRLRAAGMVESTSRGCYRVGPAAEAVNRQVRAWKQAEDRVREWDGSWIAVHTGGLSRSQRRTVRRRVRALDLLGFRELSTGLNIRPDNLVGGIDFVRERLHWLGLESDAPVFRLDALDDEMENRARALWDAKTLSDTYRISRAELRDGCERLGSLATEKAARESFVLGGKAIRQIVFDPLLPEPIIDRTQRRAFIDEAVRFVSQGRQIWFEFLGMADAPADLWGIDRDGAAYAAAAAHV
jgi:phenylacetic acid degradation operon negative regulatory protein